MHNYFDRYKTISDAYLAVNLKRLFNREALIGTDCLLFKLKENPYSEFMGTGANVLDTDNPIHVRLIFNRNYMLNPNNHQLDSVSVYTANTEIELGDVIEFRTRQETIRFKVDLREEYSIDSRKVLRLTLSGYRNSG